MKRKSVPREVLHNGPKPVERGKKEIIWGGETPTQQQPEPTPLWIEKKKLSGDERPQVGQDEVSFWKKAL